MVGEVDGHGENDEDQLKRMEENEYDLLDQRETMAAESEEPSESGLTTGEVDLGRFAGG